MGAAKVIKSPEHQPLRVIARLVEPVVYFGDGMHLDGPLSYGVYQGLTRAEQDALPPMAAPWVDDFELPLARWVVESTTVAGADKRLFLGEADEDSAGTIRGAMWGWCCSAVCADWLLSNSRPIRKRSIAHEAVRWAKESKLTQTSGRFKPTNLAHPQRFAFELVWYALGEIYGVREALARVRAVGKLASLGPGKVAEWIVEPWHADWSIERDGELMRTMPAGHEHAGGYPAFRPFRAPYHHASRRAPVITPDFDGLTPQLGVIE